MYLKRLELNGFKSFAKLTVLELPVPITAVVGPNGSGKSNIAEAIRWALGEQSMKSLRGKRGEDLIFSGSTSVPKANKASVVLVFDNTKQQFPFPYEEVAVGRTVWRDGLSEYTINGSPTRLKDVLELLSHVGLGASQHHIIRQGEADRILYASPKERQGMIEDALGLRMYQLKRHEAERKLGQTERNKSETQSIQKEIRPHLKFLAHQVEKFQQSDQIRKELQERYRVYLSALASAITEERKTLAGKKLRPEAELRGVEQEMRAQQQLRKDAESSSVAPDRAATLDAEREKAAAKRFQLERDLGRLEGSRLSADGRGQASESIARSSVSVFFHEVQGHVREALKTQLYTDVCRVLKSLEAVLAQFQKRFLLSGDTAAKAISAEERDTTREIAELGAKEKQLHDEHAAFVEMREKRLSELRKADQMLHANELKARELRELLHTVAIDEERLRAREEELQRERAEAARFVRIEELSSGGLTFSLAELERLRREIERLKIRLEEAGGIDMSVVDEFEHLKARDAFLEKELHDLDESVQSLRALMKDLSGELERGFRDGVSNINTAFEQLFSEIFNGGRAVLVYTAPKKKKIADEEEERLEEYADTEARSDEGLDIEVSIPRKRIRSLAMLSGGERALTSIALLFAVSSVNPPPFLVLDETDAALDEANSRRYGSMIEHLSKQTQIIVVTHNRETMRYAKVLYGVTMGKEASSKLLSVRLEEAEALAVSN